MTTRRPCVRFGPFSFDPERLELVRDRKPVPLDPEPARLLELLVDHPGVLVTHEQIHEHVFGDHLPLSLGGIGICARALRRTLGDSEESPRYVQEVSGEGFRFADRVTPIAPPTRPDPGEDRQREGPPRIRPRSATSGSPPVPSRPPEPEPVAANLAMVTVGAILSLLLLAAIWWLGA